MNQYIDYTKVHLKLTNAKKLIKGNQKYKRILGNIFQEEKTNLNIIEEIISCGNLIFNLFDKKTLNLILEDPKLIHKINKGKDELSICLEKLDKKFDFVACFDLIHDMTDPVQGLRTIREAVKDDGIFVLMDIKCEDDPADNKGPMAPFLYSMSLHFCMTTSLANNGLGLGTVGLPEGKVKEYCKLVGFNNVKRIKTDHPLNAVYEIRPN